MKLWEAPVSKRHITSRLETFPFKKIKQLRSLWAWFGFGAIFQVMSHFITIERRSFGLPTSIPIGLAPF